MFHLPFHPLSETVYWHDQFNVDLGNWTQALTLVGKVLYPLDHLPHSTLTSLLFNGSSINGSLIEILRKLLFSSFYIYLFSMCVRAHSTCVEAREQASGVGSSLLPCDPWDWIQAYLIWANMWLSLLFLKLVYKIIGFHLGFWHLVHFYWLSPPTLSPSLPHPPLCLSGLSINPSTLLYCFSHSSPLETLSFP